MIRLVKGTVVLPVKAVAGTAKLTTKAGAKTAAGSFKAGYRTGRLLGYRRMVVLGVGVGIGLLVAPRAGRETRELLRSRLEERGLLSPLPPEEAAVPVAPSSLPETVSLPITGNGHAGGDGEATAAATLPEE